MISLTSCHTNVQTKKINGECIMQIKGKKINFLGDSITEGIGVSAPEFKYVSVFERKFKPTLVRNYGLH